MICGWGSGMRLRVDLAGRRLKPPLQAKACSTIWLVAALQCQAAVYSYHMEGSAAGGWPNVLGSLGLVSAASKDADLFVIPAGARVAASEWVGRAERGATVVVEGDSAAAAA